MPRGRVPKSIRPEPSKTQLTAAAIDCFARLGMRGTTIDRIAKEAGVTKGAVYYYFRDKEELLFETVRDRVGSFQRDVLKEVGPDSDPISALRRVVDSCFFHATVSNHRRFIMTLMIEALDVNPRLSKEFREILQRMRGFVAGIVLQGQRHGVFRHDVDPMRAAATFVGAIMGAEIQHYQDPREVDLRAVLDAVVDVTVTSLLARSTANHTLTEAEAR